MEGWTRKPAVQGRSQHGQVQLDVQKRGALFQTFSAARRAKILPRRGFPARKWLALRRLASLSSALLVLF
jgi:hypothetical protein